MTKNFLYDVVILGGGPAGLTASLYTARAGLKTLLIAGRQWGGQLQLTSLVENYPGFPQGILGPQLVQAMRSQTEKFGTVFLAQDFSQADFLVKPFQIQVDSKTYQAKAVIVATGASHKWLGVPGEAELVGRGVSFCATCDAFF